MKLGIYRRYIKRPIDFILAFLALIILLPLFIILAIMIRLKLGKPVIFRQNRPGIGEKIFPLYKFRTMTEARNEEGELLSDHMRLKKFGRIIRSTSLDELPELYNILKGDMSIVGPRPLLVQYLPLYNDKQRQRHEVRPGLTGLAQVNGRNTLSWEDKFLYDIEYVNNITFIGDLKIILLTIKKTFLREGIHSMSASTMEPFTGSTLGLNAKSKSKDKLLIIGAGGHGRVVADIALKMNQWKEIAFLDNDNYIKKSMNIDIIGSSKDMDEFINEYDVFVAIGNNQLREKILNQLIVAGATIPILIHPNAVIGTDVNIEKGTVIMAGVIINCCTKIGKGCIINTGATVDHDNLIEDFVHLSPGVNLAGTVMIRKGVWLGIGSKVSNNISITGDCIIGAGAVVIRNITEPGTYIGIPVKRI